MGKKCLNTVIKFHRWRLLDDSYDQHFFEKNRNVDFCSETLLQVSNFGSKADKRKGTLSDAERVV